ncbi:MAG TPA: rod shape-determining protein RodA [Chloroflexia bacterium]|nr:rod shape-determining protein RodA [Chloroflexia bacterium]
MRTGRLVNIDFTLLLCTLAATVVGVLMVYSATELSRDGTLGWDDFAVKQAVYGGIGLMIMLVLARVDYRFLESFTLPFYFVVLGLLGLVGLLGIISYGSQRWLNLGLFPIQPSELAKLAVIVMLAKIYADHERQRTKLKWFILGGIVAGIPAVIVFRQPDLGTAIIVGLVFLGIAAGAKTPGRFFASLAVLAAPAIWVFWEFVMHDYQRERFLTFLHPEADPSGAGYNIIQARITIGSGGWLGQGYQGGSQSQLGFQKVQYSDFIFSVVAEQFGLLGSIALIALLFIIVWRCLVVASKAPDEYGSLIAVGVATWIGMQIFINVGMNIGLMPVTGIPLPFISYGGSSLMSILLGLGLVQSVAAQSTTVVFAGLPWSPGWARAQRTTLRPR